MEDDEACREARRESWLEMKRNLGREMGLWQLAELKKNERVYDSYLDILSSK
jgi:hypothetical protein